MTTKQLTPDTQDEQIKHLYETAFPKNEQIPWKDLVGLISTMKLDFTAYYQGKKNCKCLMLLTMRKLRLMQE